MRKKNIYILISILILAIFAGFLDYPSAWNKGADFLSSKISFIGFKIPHFRPNIPFKLGLDLQGGAHLVYQGDLSNIAEENKDSAMQSLKDAIEKRVNDKELSGVLGVLEPSVQIEKKNYRLIVDLPGEKDTNKAIQIIGLTPSLEFKEQRSQEETQKILDKQKAIEGKTLEEAQKIPDWQLAFEDPYFQSTQLTGKYLTKAEVSFDSTTNKPEISLQFNNDGAKIFEDLTSKNVGKPLAIYLDNQLVQAPIVQEKFLAARQELQETLHWLRRKAT